MAKAKPAPTPSVAIEEIATPVVDEGEELASAPEPETLPELEPTSDRSDVKPEPEPVVIPKRSTKKAKAIYCVWPHGALQRDGITYNPGDKIELSTSEAEVLGPCVVLVPDAE